MTRIYKHDLKVLLGEVRNQLNSMNHLRPELEECRKNMYECIDRIGELDNLKGVVI